MKVSATSVALTTSASLAPTYVSAAGKLSALADTLARGHTRRLRDKVESEIGQILRDSWTRGVISWELAGHTPPSTDSPSTSTTEPAPHWKPSCSASACSSPTATTSRSPRSSPATAPSPRRSSPSVSSKTPTWCRSPRCTTGLDRPQHPRPRLHLRAGPADRAPHATPCRPRRTRHERPRTARHPRRH